MTAENSDVVGSVSRLWRYPVKSTLGEEVESAEVVWSGLYGDRRYALIDAESSKLVSAKNPAKWIRMFECSSRILEMDGSRKPNSPDDAPPARITLPNGKQFDITSGDRDGAERAFSNLLGRQVRFIVASAVPRVTTIEEYHAEIEGEREAGNTTDFVRSAEAQAGTFTDAAAVHLVTTATLEALSALRPEGDFDPARFRPNVLIDTGTAKGFVESSWVGKTLALGDEVRLQVFKECGRCVMTTLPQGRLESDTGILRAILQFNRRKTGVYASVLTGGRVKKHDQIVLV